MVKTCKKFRGLSWQLQYGELAQEEKQFIDKHINTCDECRKYFEDTVKMFSFLNKDIQIIPTESQLMQSREELHQRLIRISKTRSELNVWEKLWNILSLDFSPGIRFASAFALLVVGICLGSVLFSNNKSFLDSDEMDFSAMKGSKIDEVESIKFNPYSNEISIKLVAKDDISLHGDLDEPEIQRMLAQSLLDEERPNIRLKTVRALQSANLIDPDVVEIVSKIAYTDENPGIRLNAVRLLTSLPMTKGVKDIIFNGLLNILLKEENSAIRIQAFKGISKLNGSDKSTELYNVAIKDSNEYISNSASQILERTEDLDFNEVE